MLLPLMLSLLTLVLVGSVAQIVACFYIDSVVCPGVTLMATVFGSLAVIAIPAAISVHFEVKNRERRADREEAP